MDLAVLPIFHSLLEIRNTYPLALVYFNHLRKLKRDRIYVRFSSVQCLLLVDAIGKR